MDLEKRVLARYIGAFFFLNPALKRQRQVDLCEFEAMLVYIISSRLARATW